MLTVSNNLLTLDLLLCWKEYSCLRIEKIRGLVVRCAEHGAGVQFNNRLERIALIPIYFHKLKEELLDQEESNT